MVDIIVKCTNVETERRPQKYSSTQWYLGPTDTLEAKALLCSLYKAGILKDSDFMRDDMFSVLYGSPIFQYVMTKTDLNFLDLNGLRTSLHAQKEKVKNAQHFESYGTYKEELH